ncbi:MAG TPA: carbohydrate ABC transporter permease [bacterium]|jgi:multiple sugar transport system permease protein
MTGRRVGRLIKRVGLYGAAGAFTLLAVFPFYWMFVTAFKEDRDLYVAATVRSHIPWIFNEAPTMQHFEYLLEKTAFLAWVRNTVLVGVAVVAITLVLAVPAGYALARLTGRWGERLGIGIFLTYLIPPTLLFIPFSRVISVLGLQNSLWALVLVYPTFTIPFCTWLLMGFFRSIPRDIEDQAMIDGYSRLAAMRMVVLPLAVSGVLTAAFFSFTLVMQDFVYALTFISSVGKMTVSLGIPVVLFGDVFNWGAMMAAALITSIPIAIVYNLFIDRFIAGLTAGAVKG